MSKNLVIVESPAKAKTIQGYLGKDFQVESSFGHVADLPKKGMGIDIENNFQPIYEVTADKKSVVQKLKSLANAADMVWLASDEDREGEAIAWHLKNELKLKDEKTKRIVFHEITKKAIQKAVENPRSIDYNLVNAQQARRVLDRLVGFELSPVLWKKIKGGLSAGRVQSVAVRLIVEREKEIRAFNSKFTYKITAEFTTQEGKKFKAELKDKFETKEETLKYLQDTIGATFQVKDLVTKPSKRTPSAPFTTSTLQQEASTKLRYNVAVTMQLAQRLYESGHITYMRTDSVNLSEDAKAAIAEQIKTAYGEEYLQMRNYTTKSKGAQEAHEAIRPTNMSVQFAGDDERQKKLYNLIWKRAVASQMADAQIERTVASIDSTKTKHLFEAKGEMIKFDGFLKLYIATTEDEDEENEDSGLLPKMAKGEVVNNQEIVAHQRYSKPSSRYTEASLVKKLEELGIGRPSTYAPTISTIQKREYVGKSDIEGQKRECDYFVLKNDTIEESTKSENFGADKGKLIPTEMGIVVTDFLSEHFDTIMDYGFTAQVEEEFDEIAEGKAQWNKIIAEFYHDFHDKVNETQDNAERATGERLLGQNADGKNVYVKIGRFGPMVQIGEGGDETKKPQFASLRADMTLDSVTLEQALDMFKLPIQLGEYEGKPIEVGEGRFGPYVKYDEKFISLERGTNPFEVTMEQAIENIQAKAQADAPVATYQNLPVQKAIGRFGPYLKWNNMFINVSRKYDFDHLTEKEIAEIIEDKIQKEKDKFIHNWEAEGISVVKARWGRFHLIKGKMKLELPSTFDAEGLTLEGAQKIIAENQPKKKAAPKKK